MSQISAARAHILVQETLAHLVDPDDNYTGSVTEDPSQPYPQNLRFLIERVTADDNGDPKPVRSSFYETDAEVTEDDFRDAIEKAVDAIQAHP